MDPTLPLSGYIRRITSTDPLAWEWCQVKRQVITNKSGAAAAIVAAVAGKKISVLALAICVDGGAVGDVNFDSDTTIIYGPQELAQNIPLTLPMNEHGWFETVASAALNADISAGAIDGVVVYAEVT